ncbi:MAG TPA: triose-phosphate isomerase [Firmicutes bacterium]|jgi:triosephosphate isomerase|nr:triose-phosphate isomerase [Bacillota bacterium]
MRVPIIAGNWKMNKTVPEAVALIQELVPLVAHSQGAEIVVCPPFTALYPVGRELSGTNIVLGAQNLFWADQGAYTGEISAAMLVDLGVSYVILGHSERRAYQGETDTQIANKLQAAFKAALRPILCVGEHLTDREQGRAQAVVETQLEEDLKLLSSEQVRQLVIAYEPIWAIGTGRCAEPADAADMAQMIRNVVADKFGPGAAAEVRIQYGGSVSGANSHSFLSQAGIDGALVGGASLKAEDFATIVKSALR